MIAQDKRIMEIIKEHIDKQNNILEKRDEKKRPILPRILSPLSKTKIK